MWLTGLSILFLTTDIISGNELTGNFKLSIENYEDDKIYKSYQHLDEIIKTASSTGLKMILPYVMDMQMNGLMNISSTCQRDVFTLLSELRKLKISALKCKFIYNQNLNSYHDIISCSIHKNAKI